MLFCVFTLACVFGTTLLLARTAHWAPGLVAAVGAGIGFAVGVALFYGLLHPLAGLVRLWWCEAAARQRVLSAVAAAAAAGEGAPGAGVGAGGGAGRTEVDGAAALGRRRRAAVAAVAAPAGSVEGGGDLEMQATAGMAGGGELGREGWVGGGGISRGGSSSASDILRVLAGEDGGEGPAAGSGGAGGAVGHGRTGSAQVPGPGPSGSGLGLLGLMVMSAGEHTGVCV